ncbi:MAG: polysaccharide biosynthesis/export family protein [Neomegalonema sp.]|nr:polysaccharide biosynthesis/export family protein [Neomegalonema sp.]
MDKIMTGRAAGIARRHRPIAAALFAVLSLSACASNNPEPPAIDLSVKQETVFARAPIYRLSAGDTIRVFVWRNKELSKETIIRPDGRISTPLIEDIQAAGMTPSALADEIEKALGAYLREPNVSVILTKLAANGQQSVKVLGQAGKPTQLSYFSGMTVLDVLVAVGGLTDIADGNRAVLVRDVDGEEKSFGLRLDDLVRGGDIDADTLVRPGDTIIIPERYL